MHFDITKLSERDFNLSKDCFEDYMERDLGELYVFISLLQ